MVKRKSRSIDGGSWQILELVSKQIDFTNKLLDRMNTLLEIIAGVTPPPPVIPSEVSIKPNNRSKVHTLNLSQARNKKELGLGPNVNHIVVLKCDSAAQWSRNSATADLEDLFVGYTIDDYVLTELYITNAAGSGELKILEEGRE